MKLKTLSLTAVCIAAIGFGASFTASAKEKKSASPSPSAEASASPKEKSSRPIPYRGKIASVDANAKTFTVGSKSLKVTDETKITKQGAAATWADITADEEVRGSYWKKDNGTLEAKSVKLGAMTEAEKAKHGKKKGEEMTSPEASPSASP